MYKKEVILSPFLYAAHLYFLVIRTYSMFTFSYEKILLVFCPDSVFRRAYTQSIVSTKYLKQNIYIRIPKHFFLFHQIQQYCRLVVFLDMMAMRACIHSSFFGEVSMLLMNEDWSSSPPCSVITVFSTVQNNSASI